MKRVFIVGLVLLALVSASSYAEQFKSVLVNGSTTGTDASSTDSLSFTAANMIILDPIATWDRLYGIVKVTPLIIAAGGSAIDSLGKRDTCYVTLKAIGLGGLRIDTLQVDTLVVVRDRGDIKYNFDRYVQTTTTTQFALDSGGVASDSGTTVNTVQTVTSVPRFAFDLDHLTIDFHYTDSVRTTGDSVIFSAQWLFELIDEK